MTRVLIALGAVAVTTGSLVAVHASTTAPRQERAAQPRIISEGADGKPIMLKRMVVTATALPAE